MLDNEEECCPDKPKQNEILDSQLNTAKTEQTKKQRTPTSKRILLDSFDM